MTTPNYDGREEPTEQQVVDKMAELYARAGAKEGLNGLALLYLRQNGRCFYCRRRMALLGWSQKQEHRPFQATINHFIPRLLGGAEENENWVAACFACNASKGHKLPDEIVPGLQYMKMGDAIVRLA